MRRSLASLVVVAALLLTAQPAAAQFRIIPQPTNVPPVPKFNFVPGFGLRPVLNEGFPVTGFGFDFHHHSVLNRGFNSGFFGGGFFGNNFGFGGFVGFPLASASSSVVIIQQPAVIQVPVVVGAQALAEGVPVVAGLPEDKDRVRLVASSYPPVRAPLAQLTLLVLKSERIFAVTNYWLEDGRIFYVTSTGRQDSVALRDLDWDITVKLNAERSVEFVLHPAE